jgi:hypothetical protein
MPSATKRGYIISHLDLSKSAVESKLLCGVGAAIACLASIFVFLDFLHGALASAVCYRQGFLDEVTRERGCLVDFQPPCRKSTVEARDLKASAVSEA